MTTHRAYQVRSAIAGLLLCLPAIAQAADTIGVKSKGKQLLQENCARCHSVERSGKSALSAAPPMRDIYSRLATRELQAELSEGAVSRHKEMPQISFSDEDVYAILTYLHSIRTRK